MQAQNFLGDARLHASAERYNPIRIIGKGAYGVVWSVEDVVTHERLAIKKVANVFDNIVDARRTLREIKLLQHLNHENIIKIKDVLRPDSLDNFKDVYVVYELMETDLHQIISSTQPLSDDHCQWFMEQLLRGLKYIHSAGILHRDIKPSNLLVNKNCDLKICDFNLARAGDASPDLTEYVITRWYRAPELLLTCRTYSAAVDIWSVGCILAELLMRKPLFPGQDYMHQLGLIIQVLGSPSEEELSFIASSRARRYMQQMPRRPRIPFSTLFPTASPLAIDLLEKMLVFDPTKRISIDDALRHPYFEDPLPEDPATATCPTPFTYDCESDSLTSAAIRDLIYEDVLESEFRHSMASDSTFTDEEQYVED